MIGKCERCNRLTEHRVTDDASEIVCVVCEARGSGFVVARDLPLFGNSR